MEPYLSTCFRVFQVGFCDSRCFQHISPLRGKLAYFSIVHFLRVIQNMSLQFNKSVGPLVEWGEPTKPFRFTPQNAKVDLIRSCRESPANQWRFALIGVTVAVGVLVLLCVWMKADVQRALLIVAVCALVALAIAIAFSPLTNMVQKVKRLYAQGDLEQFATTMNRAGETVAIGGEANYSGTIQPMIMYAEPGRLATAISSDGDLYFTGTSKISPFLSRRLGR